MPYFSRNPSYQFASCGGESEVKQDGELYSKIKKGRFTNSEAERGHREKFMKKNILSGKSSIFMDVNNSRWNTLSFIEYNSCDTITNSETGCGMEKKILHNKTMGVADRGIGNSTSVHLNVDGTNAKSSLNRPKLDLSRKKFRSIKHKIFNFRPNIFSWNINHGSSLRSSDYSTVLLAVFLLSTLIFCTNSIYVKGKPSNIINLILKPYVILNLDKHIMVRYCNDELNYLIFRFLFPCLLFFPSRD